MGAKRRRKERFSWGDGRLAEFAVIVATFQFFIGKSIETSIHSASAFPLDLLHGLRKQNKLDEKVTLHGLQIDNDQSVRLMAALPALTATASVTTETENHHSLNFNDLDLLQHLVDAASLSYLPSTGSGKTMESSPYYSQRLEPLTEIVEPSTESGVSVFRSKFDTTRSSSSTIVVAFRGSATPRNFLTNLRFKLVSLTEKEALLSAALSGTDECLVHEGFQDSSTRLWQILWKELGPILRQESEEKKSVSVVFTGHSLGAANALLCAARYQSSLSKSSDNNSNRDKDCEFLPMLPLSGVITFGGPRLVNRALSKEWSGGIFSSTLVRNYVHWKDPILRQNGPLWDSLGFGIVGTEVLCEHDKPVAYHDRSSEPFDDPNLPLAWNLLDHCMYLGKFVGPRLF